MKKSLIITLLAVMMLALTGCEADDGKTGAEAGNEAKVEDSAKGDEAEETSSKEDEEEDTEEASKGNYYENEDYAIKFKLSDKWTELDKELANVTNVDSIYLVGGTGNNINWVTEDLPNKSIDVKKYLELAKDVFESQLGIDMGSIKYKEYNGIDFATYQFEMKQGDSNLKFEQNICVDNGKAYVFTYTAQIAEFDDYHKEIEYLLNSVEMK